MSYQDLKSVQFMLGLPNQYSVISIRSIWYSARYWDGPGHFVLYYDRGQDRKLTQPWEENEKNRVVQEDFFKTLDVILKKDGIFYFKTDHDKYYEDVMELANSIDGYEVIYNTSDLHSTEKAEDNIKTEFEQLFLYKHNKNINYIEIKKTK